MLSTPRTTHVVSRVGGNLSAGSLLQAYFANARVFCGVRPTNWIMQITVFWSVVNPAKEQTPTVEDGPAFVFPRGVALTMLLRDATGKRHPLHPSEVLVFSGQLFNGLEHIHSCCALHADIKPENISAKACPDFQLGSQGPSDEASAEPADAADSLSKRAQWLCELEHSFVIQISDFGAARWMDPKAQQQAKYRGAWQTLWYRAPEVLCRHEDSIVRVTSVLISERSDMIFHRFCCCAFMYDIDQRQ